MAPDTKTILLAEDEEPVRTFVNALLEASGYSVILAVDGKDALEKSKAYAGKIDLLLSNIVMPGMNGVELATRLRLERAETGILLMSGFASGFLVLDEGWQFLPKPFVPEMLKAKIRRMLKEANPEDTPK